MYCISIETSSSGGRTSGSSTESLKCSKRKMSSFSNASRTLGVSSPSRFKFGTIFENILAEAPLKRSLEHPRHPDLALPTEPLEDRRADQAIAEQRRRLDDEILALSKLGLAHSALIELRQRDHTECDVARFVLHDAIGDVLDQRLALVHQAQRAERGEREPLDQDLHPEIGHVPARVAHDRVEQLREARVRLIRKPKFFS